MLLNQSTKHKVQSVLISFANAALLGELAVSVHDKWEMEPSIREWLRRSHLRNRILTPGQNITCWPMFLIRVISRQQSCSFSSNRALCREVGFNGPLYQCSIYGNKQAGQKLSQMLALGLSKPWPGAMKTMAGEDKMDATAIIDHFAPLKQWLDAENQKSASGVQQ